MSPLRWPVVIMTEEDLAISFILFATSKIDILRPDGSENPREHI